MSLSERIQQLNREIGDSVERALAELRQEISQRLRTSNDEIHRRLEEFTPTLPSSYLSHEDLAPAAERELGPGARREALRGLRESLAGIDRARSQAEILGALLRESARHASRAAVLLVRGGELRGWGGEGFGDSDTALRGLVLDAPGGAWARLAEAQSAVRLSASDAAALSSRIESPLPQDGVLVPIVLRDRVAAGLYADRVGNGELGIEALQILAHAASQAIETLPFRERSATPTLVLEGEEEAPGAPPPATPKWAQEPTAEMRAPEPPPPAAPAAEPEPAPAAAEEATEEAAPEPAYSEPEPPARYEVRDARGEDRWNSPTTSIPAIPNVTEAMPLPGIPPLADSSTLRAPDAFEAPEAPEASQPETMPEEAMPPEAMQEEAPRYPRSVEPEPAAPPPAPPVEVSPDATVLLPRTPFQSPEPMAPMAPMTPAATAPTPLRPVPVPEESDRAGISGGGAGTPEVRPPSGVEGPGWAFATTRMPVTPNNESLHEEARRLARLLVSEIKLYNEDQVEEGRRNRDIYERLKEDIDRSRQMYDERVDPQILRSTDYFYQELVRILAAGDSKALGI